ncbi:TetR/AcrR family transcriptional regulator [Plantactinospora sp. S1510]|uniref:TetR/AcrR family transcriptional regulator n=1 Tax=Plantactinospora alkalitolerans TaxID=2789879 RepID=A0ABS0GUS8_9ACTN|nr:TetR/AcrR family transcriptional regulator [Plantactinospora alkalitolerans]MBF9129758.1 TetR/AcrR family transcriptional regulator [Plantactinospora alkalitolerans]
MPRVSDEHLAARRQQILDAARRCFVRNGFHATSMQDVISEAGLSVGAVYRYFSSKHELISSIAESVSDGADELFGAIVTADPPPPLVDAVDQALAFVESQMGPDGAFPLAVQVWAESLRDPQLADFVARMYGGFRTRFVTLARRTQQAGKLPPDADPEAVGAVLFGLIQGFALQRRLSAGPDRKTYLGGVRALLAAQSRTAD